MAVKLDMAKAYDRVEWVFLRKMMERIDFPARFIVLIMDCIQSVTYSVIPIGNIAPS